MNSYFRSNTFSSGFSAPRAFLNQPNSQTDLFSTINWPEGNTGGRSKIFPEAIPGCLSKRCGHHDWSLWSRGIVISNGGSSPEFGLETTARVWGHQDKKWMPSTPELRTWPNTQRYFISMRNRYPVHFTFSSHAFVGHRPWGRDMIKGFVETGVSIRVTIQGIAHPPREYSTAVDEAKQETLTVREDLNGR